ncbi:MAG TPA: CHAP domain-containing protein [Candidatus Acidoferrum sp.]|nr:CHAP domain-containing protein [Candidatus Acidoferrum sp.]
MKFNKLHIRQALVIVTALLITIAGAAPAGADQFDNQISALQQQIASYQAQANQLKSQENTLQNAIDALVAQENAVQAQIDQLQIKLQQLQDQIDNTKKEITLQKQAIGVNLRAMYVEGDITPLEMIASSNSLGNFIDKQADRQTIENSIQQSLNKVKALQADLEKKQAEAKQNLADQQSAKNQLAAQQAQQASLLAQTQGQESAYENLVSQSNSQIATLRAEQAAEFARLLGTGYHSSGNYGSLQWKNLTAQVPCGGGYPSYYCAYGQDSVVDEWQLYNRECVSYAAWAMTYRFGFSDPVLAGVSKGFHGNGNAEDWPNYLNGADNGRGGVIVVDNSPAPHTVVIIPAAMIGGVGHAAVVESVNQQSDGEWLHVSQYNWNSPPDGKYSELDLKVVAGLIFIHF